MSCQVIQTPAPYAESLGNPKNTESRKALNMLAAALLCLAVLLAGTTASPSDAYAADTRKGYTIAAGNTQVYSNTALTKSYGTIFASDEVTVLEITSKYTKVRYPLTKGGWKTGYVRTSTMLTATTGKTYKSSGKFTTYKRPGASSYGYVANGDSVLVLGTKEKYTQIKYPVSGGYKYAFALTTDINKYLKGQSTTAAPKKSTSTQKPISVVTGKAQSTTTSGRASALASKAESQIGYQGRAKNGKGTGDYTKYGTFTGTNGQQWCASFVGWCVNQSGVPTSVVPKTANTLTMAQRSSSYRAMNSANFNKLKRGDVIFFSTTTGLTSGGKKTVHHVGIVTSVNNSAKQVTLVEGNTSKDQVKKNTYTIDPSKSGKITKGYPGHYLCGYIAV